MAAVKVGELDMWSESFTPQGEAGIWGFPPNYKALCQSWGLWHKCVAAFPTHFDRDIFLFA